MFGCKIRSVLILRLFPHRRESGHQVANSLKQIIKEELLEQYCNLDQYWNLDQQTHFDHLVLKKELRLRQESGFRIDNSWAKSNQSIPFTKSKPITYFVDKGRSFRMGMESIERSSNSSITLTVL